MNCLRVPDYLRLRIGSSRIGRITEKTVRTPSHMRMKQIIKAHALGKKAPRSQARYASRALSRNPSGATRTSGARFLITRTSQSCADPHPSKLIALTHPNTAAVVRITRCTNPGVDQR